MSCYLFAHFIGEKYEQGEQIYFSVSRDGLHWQDLNDGKPILNSTLGDCGVRDPFVVRHPKTGRYYLIATDLCIYKRRDWDDAVTNGSQALIVWESENLVDWSIPRSCLVGAKEAGCVWAPEAVWDEEEAAFMVFFASMVKLEGDAEPKQRIYSVYTQDFINYTRPLVYAEAENHLIDTTIVREDSWYYRFTKDETTKMIIMERMQNLHAQPELVHCETLANLPGVEGPECYQLPDGRWCLIVDQFKAGLGYLPLVADKLSTGVFQIMKAEEYSMGQTRKRHGGVIAITEAEYQQLLAKY